MSEQKLRIETPEPGVRLLTIDRPSRRNALDIETYEKLTEAIIAGEAEARVIVVTGAGGNFTAGNDLRDFQGAPPTGASAAMRFLAAINRCRAPLIGAVEGHAVGIGVTMLLHFDFAFAGRNAKMRMPFVPLGVSPEGASSYLIPKVAGLKRAAELLILGDGFSGEDAAEARIISAAVEDGAALDRAMATARKIAALPPESVRTAKHLIRRGDQAHIQDVMDYEAEQFRQRLASPEAQAAFAAFFAKAG